MVGSAQGWAGAAYVPVPADAAALAAALRRCETGLGRVLHIVPGVCVDGDRPDVMRGEETQAFGAIVRCGALARRSTLLLPGTHSKWVQVRAGRIESFRTFMTGELYALLAAHSILGRPAREAGATPSDDAFDEGLAAAQGDATLAGLLFSVRSRVLRGAVPAAHSLEYLSGLLIGDELRAALALADRGAPLALIGESALVARYRRALARFGRDDAVVIEGATPAGLWLVARHAGIVG
jgi:2-dehydro-3-deoxygalactonokinase